MRLLRKYKLDAIAIAITVAVFVVPFLFIVAQSVKDDAEARKWRLSWPKSWHFWSNLRTVLKTRDGAVITAMKNSMLLTVCSVALIVVLSAMVGFMLDRRRDRFAKAANVLITAGIIIPPAIVPTIFTLQKLHIFKSLTGLVLVEVAFSMPFAILLFRAFASTIPRELDEAAFIDGCSGARLFFKVIFPLMRPVIITVILTSSVAVYNDFTNPLYFLPGSKNPTAQLTVFNFQSQFLNSWNLLFMDVLIITVPPLIMFMFFNRKVVEGMTAGAVKG